MHRPDPDSCRDALSPLISAPALQALLSASAAGGRPRVRVLDCSFDLADPEAGRRAHAEARIPGASHLHLDADLSAPKTGRNGRHPLPAPADFAARLQALGLDEGDHLVVCDRSAAMFAGRLWWMLRWIGHARVQVLDGGFAAWLAAGGEVERTPPARTTPAPGRFGLRPSLQSTIDHARLRAGLGQPPRLIVDARAPDRFRGENETLDPVGGHIPGAVNRFFRDNLAADGCFKPAAALRAEWDALRDGRAPSDLVLQCGSGVTACHHALALAVAGLPEAALYPGSWSEWCAQPDAPIARG
ncbi:sulfurtransferase [Pseudaquabacterium rugosum]|uniref:Sulfurtransferase n=1 Tax=Pseudaquabacterium rugosum TaxID=2984194 RepID=A0ABU9B767_9BURK